MQIHYTILHVSVGERSERDLSKFRNSEIFPARPVCSVSRSISQRHDESVSARDLSVAGSRNVSGSTNI